MQGKIVFITGATSGFGLECARLFTSHGARVIAAGRRQDRLEKLTEELGPSVHAITLDVRDQQAVARVVEDLPDELKNIDVLINNAGLALGLSSFEDLPLKDMEQMIDTNIKGVLYVTQAVLPRMIERDCGHIINIGSVAGSYPYPGGNVYGATKAFVEHFSLNLRADLLGKNIRVTSIEPGMSLTEFTLVRYGGDASRADKVHSGIQSLTGVDIANTILWATSQPPHVNINRVELMPVMQAFSPFALHRNN